MINSTDQENRAVFDVPLLFILFNRPQHARQVLNRVRQIRPATLFVAVDGPRANRPDDQANVQQCIALLNEIDWPCTVTKLIHEQNLGCKRAVSCAIDWFFEHVETGIILEDDCLPDTSFFDFCRVLLHRYADEPKVMHIGGANLYGKHTWSTNTYFFSIIPHIWGWATWRRAWKLYDVAMGDYPQFKRSKELEKRVTHVPSIKYWQSALDGTYSGTIDTWDYQWVYTIWKNQGLCIIPNQNLITNIGFDGTATHTVAESDMANLPTVSIDYRQIKHPGALLVEKEAVNYAFAKFYQLPSWWQTKINNLKRRLYQK